MSGGGFEIIKMYDLFIEYYLIDILKSSMANGKNLYKIILNQP